jgi:hypothetical protein
MDRFDFKFPRRLSRSDTESFDCTAGHLAEGMNWTKGIEGDVCAGMYRNRLVKESPLFDRFLLRLIIPIEFAV